MINIEKIQECLIPNYVALAENGWGIPNTECWFPTAISLDLVDEVLIVKIIKYEELTKLFMNVE